MLTRDLAASDTPTSADDGYVLYSVTPAGTAVALDADSTASWSKNDGFGFVAPDGQGVITITPDPGVTIDGSNDPITVEEGGELWLVNVDGADAWQAADEAPSEIVETDAAVTLGAKHMGKVVRLAGTVAQTVTVNTGVGQVTDWAEFSCDNPAGATLAAGTAAFAPSGDVVLSYGQWAGIFQSATDVWRMSAPAPVVSSAEATSTSPKVTTGEWSPYRVQEGVEFWGNKQHNASPSVTGTEYWVPGLTPTAKSGQAYTADTLDFAFFSVPRPMRITAVTCNVSSSGGTVLRFAVVKLDDDWQPNAAGLIGQTTVDPSTTGEKVASSLTWDCVETGLYAVVSVSDGTPTVEALRGPLDIGLPADVAGTGGSTFCLQRGRKSSVGSGALSDPVDDWDTAQFSNVGASHPFLFTTEAI